MGILVILAAVVGALFWYVGIRPMNYWKKKGVKQVTNPCWLLGDNLRTLLRRESFAEMTMRLYGRFTGVRYSGCYQLTTPHFLIHDPDVIKLITIKHFDSFLDHNNVVLVKDDPLWNNNLFALRGKRWREMRTVLSPSFTSSKIKFMFVLMSDCVGTFVKYLLDKNQDIVEVEMKEIFTRFGNDVIASLAFGLKVDSFAEPNNEFYLMGRAATDFSGITKLLKFLLHTLAPKLCEILNINLFDAKISKFFLLLIKETIKQREEKGIVRPDMIQLLLDARKGTHKEEKTVTLDTGFATAEEVDIEKDDNLNAITITDVDIAAQAFIFFFGGFDSVTTEMSFMAYELAINPGIQDKLREEINKINDEYAGKLTYDALMKMKYMDMVVSETLRKWPNAVITDRICTKHYTITPKYPDESPVEIEKGTIIVIPIFGIHHDSKYYPDPMKFDPERFSEANKSKIKPCTYIPFGVGPRNCIGSRFALLEMKTVFFHLLNTFELVPITKTPIPAKFSRKTLGFTIEGGFHLGLKKLKSQ